MIGRMVVVRESFSTRHLELSLEAEREVRDQDAFEEPSR